MRGWSRLWSRTRRPPADQVSAVLCTHRFLDEATARFLADDAPGQVVLLGAGYDTRAWRFVDDLAGRALYEIDAPAVLTHKAACIQERPVPIVRRRPVPLAPGDSLSSALDWAGIERGLRTLFLWDIGAVLSSRAAVKATLSTLRSVGGPGSVLAMGGWRWPDMPHEAATTTLLGEPLRFLLHPEDVAPFLSRQGFVVGQVALPDDLARRYLRDDRPPSASAYGIIASRR